MFKSLIRPKIWTPILGCAGVLGIISFVLDYSIIWQGPFTALEWGHWQAMGRLSDSYDVRGGVLVYFCFVAFLIGGAAGLHFAKPKEKQLLPVASSELRSNQPAQECETKLQELVEAGDDAVTPRSQEQVIGELHEAIETALDHGIASREIELIVGTIERSRSYAADSSRSRSSR